MADKLNRLMYPELTDAHRIFLRLLIVRLSCVVSLTLRWPFRLARRLPIYPNAPTLPPPSPPPPPLPLPLSHQAKGFLALADAETLLANILTDFPESSGGQALTLPRVVDMLAGALFDVDMTVMWVRSEADGLAYVVFANTSSDEASENVSTGEDKEAAVTILKVVSNYLIANW